MPTLFTMNADISKFDGAGISALTGMEIHFDLNIAQGDLLRVAETPRASLIDYRRVTGYIRSDGRMWDRQAVSASPFDLTDPGNLGVRLLANDADFQLASPITYAVSLHTVREGRTTPIASWNTPPVPSSDITVNLAAYSPGPKINVATGPVSDFDPRLDDTRIPVDGSVTSAKLAPAIASAVAQLQGTNFAVTDKSVTNANSAADNVAKRTFYGCLHYDTDQKPVTGLNIVSNDAYNVVSVGGASADGNAATLVEVYVAGDQTTPIGTRVGRISATNWGLGDPAGTISQTVTIQSAAGTSRVLFFSSGAYGRWAIRTDNTAETGSDAGSNFAINAYADDGTTSRIAVGINRASLVATFYGLVSTPAPTTTTAGFRLPHGTAPTSPVNGDVWTTTGGVWVRLNGTSAQLEVAANKGVANGYASLDSGGKVPNSQIPSSTVTKSDVGLGNVDNTSDANKPVSTATQTALDAAIYNRDLESVAVGEETMLRRNIVSTQVSTTASSQYLRLTYFTARKTETITQVRTLTGATPATSATLCKIGIFSEDPATGNLTRVAVTADEKANIWLAASTAYTVSLASGFTKTKGTRYAVACLYVGTGNAPTFYGNASIVASEAFVAPRIAAMGPASTDMPTSISNSSLTAQSHQVYTVLLP